MIVRLLGGLSAEDHKDLVCMLKVKGFCVPDDKDSIFPASPIVRGRVGHIEVKEPALDHPMTCGGLVGDLSALSQECPLPLAYIGRAKEGNSYFDLTNVGEKALLGYHSSIIDIVRGFYNKDGFADNFFWESSFADSMGFEKIVGQ